MFGNAGYLTIDKILDEDEARIRIPNKEVQKEFKSLTAHYLHVDESRLKKLFTSLMKKDVESFFTMYEDICLTVPSYYDLRNENSYHLMMLGMSIFMESNYHIISNRENGKGRADIILKKKIEGIPNIVLEMKYNSDNSLGKGNHTLKRLAHEALQQIHDKEYCTGLTGETLCIGLAHHGKDIYMEYKEVNV